MGSVQRSVHINCPPDDVYDIAIVDVEGLPEWMKSVKSVDEFDDSWPEEGSSHRYTGTMAGQLYAGRTTIARERPPFEVEMREETFSSRDDGKILSEGRSLWRFEPEESGTRVTVLLEGTPPHLVGRLIWLLFGQRRSESRLESTLATLKRICEEEQAASTKED